MTLNSDNKVTPRHYLTLNISETVRLKCNTIRDFVKPTYLRAGLKASKRTKHALWPFLSS